MNNGKGMTFLALMIVVAVTGLCLRFAIEQFINWNIAQGEAGAQDTLKLLSTAIENYAEDHLGMYPLNLSALCQSEPPYIDKAYTQMGVSRGYLLECTVMDANGYSCYATPVRCKLTGKNIYRVTTGGSMISEECTTKE